MTWDLTKLYASFDAPEFAADMEELKDLSDAAAARMRALTPSVPALEEAVRLADRLPTASPPCRPMRGCCP